MVVVDLDGTLLSSDRRVSDNNLRALERVQQRGGRVVAATGRSLASVRTVLGPNAPMDAVAFSTGAGVVDWSTGEMLSLKRIEETAVRDVVSALVDRDHGFMLHAPDPEEPAFFARRSSSRRTDDFDRRLHLYGALARPWAEDQPYSASVELLLIEDAAHFDVIAWAREAFPRLSVIHATSPIDHCSLWIQLLAEGACKAAACEFLASQWGIDRSSVVGVGNDYNDVNFLEWVGHGFIVDNAPSELRTRFTRVASNDDDGVADALRRF